MRVLISSVGTRGDVQPAVALAIELRTLGHHVRLCVPPNFTAWAGELGFEATAIGVEMRAPPAGSKPAPLPDLITDQFDAVTSAADGCELIVGAGAHQYAARSIAEVRGIPFIDAVYSPTSLPSAELEPAGQAQEPDGPQTNLRLWDETRRSWNQRPLERVNANRARLKLAPIDDVITHILGDRPWLAADATLAPLPATLAARVVQTGAWILPDPSALSAELEAFLQNGEPPIYLGFGSMPVAADVARTIIETVRLTGRRVILSRGWAELALLDDATDCMAIGDTNHQALFPRVAGVIHHGGAGTTTTAALAGAPQLAVPMFSDQFYWGRRISKLGIGSSVALAGLTREALASALHDVLAPAVADRARATAANITTNGAAIAARQLATAHG